ncbi:MAG: hypothetical protein WCK09_18225 [Bacteroidota bacterium]
MSKTLTTFKPGQGGRPKGVKNRITREIQEKVEWALEILDTTLEEDLKKMRPAERVRLWADMQEYIRPKLHRVNMGIEAESTQITKIIFEVVGEGEVPEELEE